MRVSAQRPRPGPAPVSEAARERARRWLDRLLRGGEAAGDQAGRPAQSTAPAAGRGGSGRH
jgi:hypothetical protein